MGTKVFGRHEGVPYFCNAAAGIEDDVFAMLDSTATSPRGCKVATANARYFDGVIGVVQTGIWHGHYGTSADKYPQNADLNIVAHGQVRVKITQTDSNQADYLADGNFVCIGTGGKATKWAAPSLTVTPGSLPSIGATNTADRAADITAYVADYVQKYVSGSNSTGYVPLYRSGFDTCVGRVVGAPVDGLVTVELRGLGGIQHG